jgi:hypothetical protein
VRSGEEVTHKYLLGRVAVSRLVTAETLKRDILLFAYTGRAIKKIFFFFLFKIGKGKREGSKMEMKKKRKNQDERKRCEEVGKQKD